MKIYGTNNRITNHDLSVCRVSEKSISGISMERIDRIKKSPKKVQDHKNFNIIAYYNYFYKYFGIDEDISLLVNFPGDHENYIEIKDHHYMHACSAFFASSYVEAAILTVDASGATSLGEEKKHITQGIWKGRQNKIASLHLNYVTESRFGIGYGYALISSYIGLEVGSTMGLSSYGNHHIKVDFNFFIYDGKSIHINPDIFQGLIHDSKNSEFSVEDYNILFTNKYKDVSGRLDKIFGVTPEDYIEKKRDITKSKFADIAAKLQYETEKAMVYLANCAYKMTGSKNLCLAGGVALNINANTRILKETPFENIFVQPAATDDGLSLGAAYYGYYLHNPDAPRIPMVNASLGKCYTDKDILQTLLKYQDKITYSYDPNSYIQAAEYIRDNKIIGWFYKGSEFGPRALGNRSIFANANSQELRDRVNDLKKRQRWRPLAPMLLEEELDIYFEDAFPNYFMTTIGTVREDRKKDIAGVVHVDGTARYQTINEIQNLKTYKLLKKLKEIKGNSVIINTSFNTRGEPIVETPEDALKMFLSTQMDVLILENFIIYKDGVYSEYAYDYGKVLRNIRSKFTSVKNK